MGRLLGSRLAAVAALLLAGCPGPSSPPKQAEPPAITAQPASLTVAAGDPATFSVTATATGTLSYQWQKKGVDLPGKTAALLELTAVQDSDAGSYTVVVTNTVDGSSAAATSVPASLTVNVPPTITAQPQPLTVVAGGDCSFSVTATGSGTLSYQWRKGGSALPGETGPTLSLLGVHASEEGSYDVVVTNTLLKTTASSTSDAATCSVNVPPAISTQPTDLTVAQGGSGSFSVTATGNGTLSYQWQKDGLDLPGQTGSTLSLSGVQPSDAGSYGVVVTNTLGKTTTTAKSAGATLTVNVPPTISSQPVSVTVAEGGSCSFSLSAWGSGVLTYQWQKGGVDLPGQLGSTLTLSAVLASDAGSYGVVVTSTLDGTTASTNSAAATLTVNLPPTITAQPAPLTVAAGGSGSFSVTAAGTGTLSYQWQKGGTDLPGQTAATLSLTAVQASDAGNYAVVVTNSLDGTTATTTSSQAALTVVLPPAITAHPRSLTRAPTTSAAFSVAATGSGTLSYQWQKGGVDLPGQTAATLSLGNVQPSDAGSYRAVVTNTVAGVSASAASGSALLTVSPAVTAIAIAPASISIPLGRSAQLVATATYADATTGDVTDQAQWTSGSPANVTVDATGMAAPATGASAGAAATVTATLVGKSASAQVSLLAAIAPIGPGVGNDPLLGQQWHLHNTGQSAYSDQPGSAGNDLNALATYAKGYSGAGVKVAVVDTGLEILHEDLAANVVPGSWSFAKSTANPTSSVTTGDHGTSVAGLIAMVHGNALGGMGVAPRAGLNGYDYLSSSMTTAQELASLGGSSANPLSSDVWVFNQSYGYENTIDFLADPTLVAQYASGTSTLRGGRGAIYVKSAGNGFSQLGYADCSAAMFVKVSCQNVNMDPYSALPYVVLVGALDARGVKSSYSTTGSALWVSAPGGEYGYNASVAGSSLPPETYQPGMVTTDQSGCAAGFSVTAAASSTFDRGASPNGTCSYTNTFTGTSAAAPATSGAIALILEANPTLGWRDVKHILATTATRVDPAIAPILDSSLVVGPYVAELPWTVNAAGYAFHNWYGFGRVNVDAAVRMAETYPYGQLGTLTVTPFVSSGTLSLSIPDNWAPGVTSTLAMPTDLSIEAVQITVSATHQRTGDLGIELVSPSGTRSILLNIKNVFNGTSLRQMVLESNAFYGERSAGTWTLRLVDGRRDMRGTLTNWQLRVFGH